jgi:DNA-binding transcriptional ArsR family regulator
VIRIELGPDGLAHARFAISPLRVAIGLIYNLRRSPGVLSGEWRGRAAEVIAARRLSVLACVAAGGPHGYAPDFLAPEPEGYEAALDEELHLVARTSAERVRYEMSCLVNGHPLDPAPARMPSARLAPAIDGGEQMLAGRLADELGQFCQLAIAPQWSRLRARMEDDIAARTEVIARCGYLAMISELAPTVSWCGGGLDLALGCQGRITASTLILTPAPFGLKPLHSLYPADAPGRRAPLIIYPAVGRMAGRPAAPDELIGATRARLLAALSTPRSTPELAELLFLSPSTVSYHLQILYRAGLARRFRRSRQVLYQRAGALPMAGESGPGS